MIEIMSIINDSKKYMLLFIMEMFLNTFKPEI
jgi:hypothetical protein